MQRCESTELISLILPDLRIGGTEVTNVALAREFNELGYRVDIVTGWETVGDKLILPAGVSEIVLGVRRTRELILPLVRYFNSRKPAAVLVSMWPFTIVTLIAHRLSCSNAKIATWEHSLLSLQYAGWGPLHRFALSLSVRMLYPLANSRIVVSRAVSEDFERFSGIPSNCFTVIYNPVAQHKPPATDNCIIPDWGGWKGPRIITVGRLSAAKNHALLISAFKRLLQFHEARLMIVGGGELAEFTAKFAEAEGVAEKIIMPGAVVDPTPYYLSADLFVLSSDYEGFGNVLVEALACGLPVVSTDCPGGPSEILGSGQFGRLCPVKDVDALACAMSEALLDQVDHEALRRRAQEFSAHAVIPQFVGALEL